MTMISNRTWALRFACIAVAFLGLAVSAVTVRSEQDANAQKMTAAADLLDAMGGIEQARKTIGQLKEGMIKDVTRRSPDMAPAFAAFVQKELAPDSARVTAYLKDIEKIAVDFYSKNFTIAEMKEVAAFQRSSAGKKFQQESPNLLQSMTPRMMQFQRDLIQDVQGGKKEQ
ncbi:MAG: DUF2059 domain-containing protein [Hyphomicrobiaceae bacterium]